MAIRMSNTRALAALDAVVGSAATLKIFSGSAPTNVSDADTGTQLATMSCAFGSSTDGTGKATAAITGSISDSSTVSGVAGYYRVYPTGATSTNALFQGSVGTSGADLNLNDTDIPSGATLTISSLTIDLPELGS